MRLARNPQSNKMSSRCGLLAAAIVVLKSRLGERTQSCSAGQPHRLPTGNGAAHMPKNGGLALSGCMIARCMCAGSSVNAAQSLPSASKATPRKPGESSGGSGGRSQPPVVRPLHASCAAHGWHGLVEAVKKKREAVWRKNWRGKDYTATMRHRLRLESPVCCKQGGPSSQHPITCNIIQRLQTNPWRTDILLTLHSTSTAPRLSS